MVGFGPFFASSFIGAGLPLGDGVNPPAVNPAIIGTQPMGILPNGDDPSAANPAGSTQLQGILTGNNMAPSAANPAIGGVQSMGLLPSGVTGGEVYDNIFQLDGQLLSIYLFIISSFIYLAILLGERQRNKDVQKVNNESDSEKKTQEQKALQGKWAWLPYAFQVAAIMALLGSLWFLNASLEDLNQEQPDPKSAVTVKMIFFLNMFATISAIMRMLVVFVDPQDTPEEIATLVPVTPGAGSIG